MSTWFNRFFCFYLFLDESATVTVTKVTQKWKVLSKKELVNIMKIAPLHQTRVRAI